LNVRFHPDAQAELDDAIDFYEEREIGLGVEFASDVFEAIDRAIMYPRGWSGIAPGIRRCQTQRFPYGVLFSIESSELLFVLAVMHLHREPGYWKDRQVSS
jgi:toxin ParE1/3/4